MDLKDSLVKGGVLIKHQIHDGKHQYEVENVMKYKKGGGAKSFARTGDKVVQINNIDLQDVGPEVFAQMLAETNPMLTVHKANRVKAPPETPGPAEDILYPFSKESALLSFNMEMKREEDLEANEVEQEGQGREDVVVEEDACKDETREDQEGGDLLIVSMTKTSISVVRGRGCNDGTGCTLNDVVVVAESSSVTLVPRGSGSFKREKMSNVSVKHVASHQYLKILCSQIYASPNPAQITIYSYKANVMDRIFRGIPVVLNFTESNCFLRCCKTGERVLLQVETCEKQKLLQISKSDENALSFVFYMKSDHSKQRKFESALYHGWFIQIADSVGVATQDGGQAEQSFLFIIQK